MFAQNLLHGFYSPPAPAINLWNGPGYPLILAPFVGLRWPLIAMAMLNAAFYYLSIVFLSKALHRIISYEKALAFSLFWACYLNAYQKMPRINSETFTLFLVSLLSFFLLKSFVDKSNTCLFLSGVTLGAIVLTKIMFGYVLMFMLLFGVLPWIWRRPREAHKRGIAVLLIAFAAAAPYLIYTYHLTGRMFYWGNSGGLSLYWLSTPYRGEFGDFRYGELPEWHKRDLAPLSGLQGIARDDALKKIALNNIRSHPGKFAKNWAANLGRLFFNFPYSPASNSLANVGDPLRALALLPLNAMVFLLMLYSFFITLGNWKQLEYFIRFLFSLVFLYLGASSLVSAYSRQFYVIVPALLLWMAYIADRSLKVKIKKVNGGQFSGI